MIKKEFLKVSTLSVCVVAFAMLITPVFAENVDSWDTLKTALGDGINATLTKDVTADQSSNITVGGSNVIMDLNSNTITGVTGSRITNAIENFTFKNGTATGFSATNGGVIFNNTGKGLTVTSSNFNNNTATQYGGAIINNGGTVNISKSTFDGNSSQTGAIDNRGIMTIADSYIKNNSSSSYTGGVYNTGDITINNTKFVNNTFDDWSGSGAFHMYSSTGNQSQILNSYFEGNKAINKTPDGRHLGSGGAIAISNGNLLVDNTEFKANQADAGGAIYVLVDSPSATLTVQNSKFDSNFADAQGGALSNMRISNIYNTEFVNNYTTNDNNDGGGAIFLGSESTTKIDNTIFAGNNAPTFGGAIATRTAAGGVNLAAKLDITNSQFIGNTALYTGTDPNEHGTGGAIDNYFMGSVTKGDSVYVGNTIFNQNQADMGGAIYNHLYDKGENLVAMTIENSIFTGNTATNNGGAIYNDGIITFTGVNTFSGNTANGVANDIYNAGTINISGILNLGGDITDDGGKTYLDAGGINVYNDIYTSVANLGELTLNQTMGLGLSANLADKKINQIKITSLTHNDNKIKLDLNTKVIPAPVDSTIILNPIALEEGEVRTSLAGIIEYTDQTVVTPIYNYDSTYDSETGLLTFTRGNFNPSVSAGAVAAQIGGYLNQLNSYENAFEHIDYYMLLNHDEREDVKNFVKYVFNGDNSMGAWVRPYASFEKVNFSNGLSVDNDMYGSYAGLDSGISELRHGWDMVYSAYASYDGSTQHYNGNDIYQNGGHLGATMTLYKGDFFGGLTINAGAGNAKAVTMYGTDNMPMLMAGAAAKTGYNLELVKNKFIVQPSMLFSYSFVNMFDYTNSANVRIHSDPLHALQLAPELKLIANLPYGWQPYLDGKLVWNIMDETQFYANDIKLPELSTKHYVQYGAGVQRVWCHRFAAYAQASLRNIDRVGVAFNAGFRLAF